MDPYNEIERLLQEKREEAEEAKINAYIAAVFTGDARAYRQYILRLYDLIVVIASLRLLLKSLN